MSAEAGEAVTFGTVRVLTVHSEPSQTFCAFVQCVRVVVCFLSLYLSQASLWRAEFRTELSGFLFSSGEIEPRTVFSRGGRFHHFLGSSCYRA